MTKKLMLVTGATGLIGSHVVEQALATGYAVRALARQGQDPWLATQAVEIVQGDLRDDGALRTALSGVQVVVHCAAKVGDWGDPAEYRAVNVDATAALLRLARESRALERLIAISSLGVYPPRDHDGTDESEPISLRGFDAYTRTKAESEALVVEAMRESRLPAVVIRPGFIYGARDRHVLPNLLRALRTGVFTYFGDGQRKLDHVYVKNLVHAIFAAIETPAAVGEIFNITDDPVATRRVFIETLARCAGLPAPTRQIPRSVAYALSWCVDHGSRVVGVREAPLLSLARYKFLALNLDYSIAKAKRVLGYAPPYTLAEGMAAAVSAE